MHTGSVIWRSQLLSLRFDKIILFFLNYTSGEEQPIWDIMKSKISIDRKKAKSKAETRTMPLIPPSSICLTVTGEILNYPDP